MSLCLCSCSCATASVVVRKYCQGSAGTSRFPRDHRCKLVKTSWGSIDIKCCTINSLRIFPVYDQTLPTEAVPLVFTVGVTVAIAYELPSKPWYELAKQIKENIRNGEYLLKKDENVTQLSYVDTQVAKNEFLGQTNNLLQQQAPVSSAAWTKHSYYYKDKPSYYKQPVNYYSNPLTKTVQPISNKMDYYFGNQNKNQYNFGKWANQLSSWTNKYLTSKPGQTKSPIYWSDVIKKYRPQVWVWLIFVSFWICFLDSLSQPIDDKIFLIL